MARHSLPPLSSKFVAIALLVASAFVALVLNVGLQDSDATSVAFPEHVDAVHVADDSSSLIQGVSQIVRLSIHDEKESGSEAQLSMLEAMATETASEAPLSQLSLLEISEAPVESKSQAEPSFLALTTSSLRESVVRISHRLGVRTSIGITLIVIVVFVTMLICTAAVLLRTRRRGQCSAPGQSQQDIAAAVLEKRELMIESRPFVPGIQGLFQAGSQNDQLDSATYLHTSPLPGNIYPPNQTSQRAASGASLSAPDPFLDYSLNIPLPHPRRAGTSPSTQPSLASIGSQLNVKPPPLCPSLVMPMSEALLGIPMYELAKLSHEGTLNIVGVSGKPLLRAEVKVVGNTRALEILMPDSQSIPRAYVGPPTSAGRPSIGSRVLEIRGMRGTFYGILEMGSSGACYVVKDGQTVLNVDGDAESLQLSLKSSGCQVAAVRCSTEQFDGVDHVELRVEPGTDTVLVVAVVLSVLLLSPYLPPVGSDDADVVVAL